MTARRLFRDRDHIVVAEPFRVAHLAIEALGADLPQR